MEKVIPPFSGSLFFLSLIGVMKKRVYIEDFHIGYRYKARHYRKWLIYLGPYRTYHPGLGFRELHAFVKDREGSLQFILYSTINKTFHTEKPGNHDETYLDKLRTLVPEIHEATVTGVVPVGDTENSLSDLLQHYRTNGKQRKTFKKRDAFSIPEIFTDRYYLSVPVVLIRFNTLKLPPKRLRKNDLYLYKRTFLEMSIDDVGRIVWTDLLVMDSMNIILGPPFYHRIRGYQVQFSNGQTWNYKNLIFRKPLRFLKLNEE